MDNVLDEIVISVEFNGRQSHDTFASEVQVVRSDIQWEDLELMVRILRNYPYVSWALGHTSHRC